MSSDQPPSYSQQQPSPELLRSLGIKVRDFAYENTLPAIVPVPRVPRQVQPAPRPLKRSQREWEDKQSTKKPRSLERKPTEPLHEPAASPARTLGRRITVRRVCSIIIPALPPQHTRFSASPPTSPLTPSLSQSDPFVVHVEDTTIVPASRADAHSFATFTLGARSSLRCSPAPTPPHVPAAPLLASPLPSSSKEREVDPRVRKPRSRGNAATTPAPNRYQLRKRPTPNSCPRRMR